MENIYSIFRDKLLLRGEHVYPSLSPYSQTDGITDREMNTLAVHGLEKLFSSCAVVSVFGSGGK